MSEGTITLTEENKAGSKRLPGSGRGHDGCGLKSRPSVQWRQCPGLFAACLPGNSAEIGAGLSTLGLVSIHPSRVQIWRRWSQLDKSQKATEAKENYRAREPRPRLMDFERAGVQGLQRQERQLHSALRLRGASGPGPACAGTRAWPWPAWGQAPGHGQRGDRDMASACAGAGTQDATSGGEVGPPTHCPPTPAAPGPPSRRCPPHLPPGPAAEAPVRERGLAVSAAVHPGTWPSRAPGARHGAGRGVTAVTSAAAASSRCASPTPGADPVTRTRDTGLGDAAGPHGRRPAPLRFEPGCSRFRTRCPRTTRPLRSADNFVVGLQGCLRPPGVGGQRGKRSRKIPPTQAYGDLSLKG